MQRVFHGHEDLTLAAHRPRPRSTTRGSSRRALAINLALVALMLSLLLLPHLGAGLAGALTVIG